MLSHGGVPSAYRNIDLRTPYPVEEEGQERLFTYLDTVGRPVVVARKKNLVEEHILDFQASASFLQHYC